MTTTQTPPGRHQSAAPPNTPGANAGAGATDSLRDRPRPSAMFLDELGALLDSVFDADKALAAAAARRAVAIDAARVHSERTDFGMSRLSPEVTRRSLIGELACGLRLPAPSAATLLEESRALVNTLPNTLTALGAGNISYRHAQILVHETYALTSDIAHELELAVLGSAGRLSPTQFDRKVRKARERLDPDAISTRHERSVADRSLSVTPARDGMCWLSAYVAAADGAAIHSRVTEHAVHLQGADEQRTLTQLRVDVFRDLILDPTGGGITGTTGEPGPAGAAPGAGGDRFRGTKPDLIVTVPMLTLLGVAEEPGNLDGYGPIDPDTARDLASRCPSAIRILTHPETGAILSVGRDRYVVPASLRTFLQIRDGTCRFPYSSRAARDSDIDHTLDWQYTGETRHDNLAHLSPAAHALKHEAGWIISQADNGSGTLTWVTPTGHVYITEPENVIGSAISAEHRTTAQTNIIKTRTGTAAIAETAVSEAVEPGPVEQAADTTSENKPPF